MTLGPKIWPGSAGLRDFLETGIITSDRKINAGDGLTGGGDLSTDITLTAEANADGSIVVDANGIQVGILASDAQHGERSGGNLHDLVDGSSHGFMSFVDKNLLDGYLPSKNEKTALAGSYGTLSSSNKYLTETDPRLITRANTITVSATQGNFTSVKAATESIHDAAADNPYIIYVSPGVYIESPFAMQPYVSIMGKGGHNFSIIIQTNNNSTHFITGSYASNLADVDIVGPTGDGCAAIYYSDNSYLPFRLDAILIDDGYYGILCNSSGFGIIEAFNIGANNTNVMNAFMYVQSGFIAAWESSVSGTIGGCVTGYKASGSAATMLIENSSYSIVGGGNAVFADDGAFIRLNTCTFSNGTNGLHIGSTGIGTKAYAVGCTFLKDNFTLHLLADTPDCTIVISGGLMQKDLISIPTGITFHASFVNDDINDSGLVIYGELFVGPTINNLIPLINYTEANGNTGLALGGVVTKISGLNVSVSEGYGYINDGATLKKITWNTTTLPLTPDKEAIYIIVDSTGVIKESFSVTSPNNTISFAISATDSTDILILANRAAQLPQSVAQRFIYARDIVGPISVSGTAATKYAATSLQLTVDAGSYYIYDNAKTAYAHSPITFSYWFRNNLGKWTAIDGYTSIFTDGYDAYNYGGIGGITTVPAGKFKRDLLYLTSDSDTEYHIVFGQQLYNSALLAIDNPNPPDIFNNICLRLAGIIVQQGASDISSIADQRPKLGQLAAAGTAVTDHGSLSGLSDDDHAQYQLRTEKNIASGYCGLNGSIQVATAQLPFTSTPPANIDKSSAVVGSSNQIAFSDHKHDISTAAPSNIGASNVEGNATSLSRSNHIHDHGEQTDGYFHQVAVTGLPGFMDGTDKRKLDNIESNATYSPLTSSAPLDITKDTAVVGNSVYAARSNHKHDISTAAPSTIGMSNSEGGATSLARSNHIHYHGEQTDGYLHQTATTGLPGFFDGADKRKLNGLPTSAVPTSQQVIAGAGLTGGGALTADVTLNVIANADNSITVNANDIQVGVLATDGQHGNRGNGSLHTVATTSVNGFFAATDKVKFDGYLPTAGEKLALAGSVGTPSDTNRYITQSDPKIRRANIINVSNSGGDYSSVKDAITSITTATSSNPFAIHIAPGTYTEDPFTMKPYVSIIGKGGHNLSVILQTTNNNAHFITGSYATDLIDVSIIGPTEYEYAAINYADNSTIPFSIYNVIIFDGYYGIWCHPSTFGLCYVYNCGYVYNTEAIDKFIYVQNGGVLGAFTCAVDGPSASCANGYYASGDCNLVLENCEFSIENSRNAVFADNGADVFMTGCLLGSGINAIHVGSTGTGTKVISNACYIYDTYTYDIIADTPNCLIEFNAGSAHANKLSIPTGTNFISSFADDTSTSQGMVVLGELWLGDTTSSIPLKSYTNATTSSGLSSGGDITKGSGLVVNIAEGYGYINNGLRVSKVHWLAQPLTLTASKTVWIVVDSTGVIGQVYSLPDDINEITLGIAATSNTKVVGLATHSTLLTQSLPARFLYSGNVIGPISVSGTAATKYAATSLQLAVDAGTYYIYDNQKTAVAHSPITFTYWHRDSVGNWLTNDGYTSVNADNYDAYNYGGSGFAPIPSGKFKRDLLFLAVNGSGTEYHMVYGQQVYATAELAVNNPNPPTVYNNIALRVAAIIVQQGASDISSVSDQRPKLGQLAAAGTAVTVHSQLAGLSSNDHLQYQLRTEKNIASGYCGLNSSIQVETAQLPFTSTPPNDITKSAASAGSINEISKADHKHNISTDVPSTIGASNIEGNATSLARSNHIHYHGQLTDGYYHQTATTGLPGFFDGADKRKLNGLITNAVPNTIQVIAGAGLTGGGALTADVTLNVIANADNSITVNANDIQVGILASDAQHGTRGGGTIHSVVTTGANGFMIASDKSKLDGIASSATNTPLTSIAPLDVTKAAAVVGDATVAARGNHKHDVSTAAPISGAVAVNNTVDEGTATSLARSDHRHAVALGSSVAVGTANSPGSATSFVRSDHVHAGLTRGSADFSTFTEKTTPVAADLVLAEDSAASNAKVKIQLGNIIALDLFGRNFTSYASEGNSQSTSSTYATKLTATTATLTGTYRISYYCEMFTGTNNRDVQCRLYNSTDSVELCQDYSRLNTATTEIAASNGFAYVTFTGAAKTFLVQYNSPNNTAQATIRRARIEIWRVS